MLTVAVEVSNGRADASASALHYGAGQRLHGAISDRFARAEYSKPRRLAALSSPTCRRRSRGDICGKWRERRRGGALRSDNHATDAFRRLVISIEKDSATPVHGTDGPQCSKAKTAPWDTRSAG